jgi:hypothetical protein
MVENLYEGTLLGVHFGDRPASINRLQRLCIDRANGPIVRTHLWWTRKELDQCRCCPTWN